jgi:tetratricopeptide (TPR) repeat protein
MSRRPSTGHVDVAQAHSERAVAAIPTHVPSMFLAGASNYALSRLEAAHRHLTRVLARDPDHAPAQLLLAATNRRLELGPSGAVKPSCIWRRTRQPPRAHLIKVVTIRPNDAIALNNLAWTLLQDGSTRAARAYAERALDLAPHEPQVMDTLAVVLMELGELDRASELLQRAA